MSSTNTYNLGEILKKAIDEGGFTFVTAASPAAEPVAPSATDDPAPPTDWRTSPPSQITLNIGVSKKIAEALRAIGVESHMRDWNTQLKANKANINAGVAAGVNMNGSYHVQAGTGLRIMDNGLKTEFGGHELVCMDRIWYDLVNRLGLTFTGLWMVKTEHLGKVSYNLKIRFDSHRDKEGFVDTFTWFTNQGVEHYNINKPNDGLTPEHAAAADTKELKRLLDKCLKRLFKKIVFWRNPNRTWTINSNGGYEGTLPETYHRVRVLTSTEVATAKVKTPKYQQFTVAPRKRAPRQPAL